VQAGKAAGCRVLGVLGTHSADDLRAAGVDWVVETLEHVKAESTPTGLRLTFDAL
jgi:sugar-phosphatase